MIQTQTTKSSLTTVMDNFLSKHRRALRVYILWFTLHFVFLFVLTDNFIVWNGERETVFRTHSEPHYIRQYIGPENRFWPFNANIDEYDLSEFLFYSILPILLYTAIRLLNIGRLLRELLKVRSA